MDVITRKGGLLYPMLVIAAIAVIVFSVTGIATMMGWLPSALSGRNAAPGFEQSAPRGDAKRSAARAAALRLAARRPAQPAPLASAACRTSCGVVESIRAVETQGQTQLARRSGRRRRRGSPRQPDRQGRGTHCRDGRRARAPGAYAGNEIEKHVKKSVRYRVRVRMDDGSYRTFHEAAQPAYAVGQKVRVTERGIVPLEERRASNRR